MVSLINESGNPAGQYSVYWISVHLEWDKKGEMYRCVCCSSSIIETNLNFCVIIFCWGSCTLLLSISSRSSLNLLFSLAQTCSVTIVKHPIKTVPGGRYIARQLLSNVTCLYACCFHITSHRSQANRAYAPNSSLRFPVTCAICYSHTDLRDRIIC